MAKRLEVSANGSGGGYVVNIYGDIGARFGGVTPEELLVALANVRDEEPLRIHIHSDGGDFHDGIAIHSMLARRSGVKTVVVDGLAASAASLVAMAGDEIEIARGGWVMIHEAQGSLSEKPVAQFREAVRRLEAYNAQSREIYAPRWKGTDEELAEAMRVETWLSDDQAVAAGLADRVAGDLALAAHVDGGRFAYAKIPEPLANACPRRLAAEEKLAAWS